MTAARALSGRVVGAALSLALIGGLVVVVGDPAYLVDALTGDGLPVVLAAVALYLLNGLLKAARWLVLLRAGGVAVTPAAAYRAFLIGMAVNNLLPSGVAGEPVRLARLRGGMSAGGVAATATDRMLDLAVVAAAAVAGIPFLAGLDPRTVPAVAVAGGLAFTGALAVTAWMWRRARLRAPARRPLATAGVLLMTVAIQANDPVRLVLLASGYGVELGFWRGCAIVAVATVVGALTIVGVGAGMAVTIGALLAAGGASAETAAALGLVFVATSAWLSLPLGALAAVAGRRPAPRPTEARWT